MMLNQDNQTYNPIDLSKFPDKLRNNAEILQRMMEIQKAKETLNTAAHEQEINNITKTDFREDYVLTDEEKKEYEKRIKFDEFENMHLIEILTIRKAIHKNLSNLMEGKSNALSYLVLEHTFSELLNKFDDPGLQDNALDAKTFNSYKESIEEELTVFRKSFAKDFASFKYGLKLCDDQLAKFDNPDSLKFITSEILFSFTKNKEMVEKSFNDKTITEKEYKHIISANDICLDAIANRLDLSYIKKKFNCENKAFRNHLKRVVKLSSDKLFERTDRILGENMRTENLNNSITFLKERYKDKKYGDRFSEVIFDFSAHMIKSGLNSGHYIYWKLFIGNISAIVTGNFDMEEMNKDTYLESIDTLYPEFEKIYLEFQ